MKNKIVELLDSLKFKGMSLALDHQIAQAEKKGLSIQEVIYHLLYEEMRFRQERCRAGHKQAHMRRGLLGQARILQQPNVEGGYAHHHVAGRQVGKHQVGVDPGVGVARVSLAGPVKCLSRDEDFEIAGGMIVLRDCEVRREATKGCTEQNF